MSNAPIGMFDSGLGGTLFETPSPAKTSFITVIVSTHRTATETPST